MEYILRDALENTPTATTIPTTSEHAQTKMLNKFASGFALYLYYPLKMVEALTRR